MAWLHSVYFLDQNRGWVAGSNGTLLQTTDGGETWKKISSLTKDTLRDVYFADENVGWLLANRDPLRIKADEPTSYLLKTEDGGFSWRQILLTGAGNARLVRMVFSDGQHGCVFGESGVVFATRDGGGRWLPQASPTKHLLLGGTYLDKAHAWLVGAGATIVRTSDGGTSWQIGFARDAANVRFNAATFVSNNLGWAVGNAGRIFTTADGGRTWYAQRADIDADIFDVKFVDAREGWAAGTDGLVLHTSDAGAHWKLEPVGVSHALQRLFFIDRDHGWAVGFGGTILTIGRVQAPSLR